MVKLYKIKLLKDTEKGKKGKIYHCSKKDAESYVKNGYAEYIEESKKPKKAKKFKKKVKEKENNKIKEFYDKYVGKISCAFKRDIFLDNEGKERCSAKRKEQKEKYIFKGLTDDVVLIECPKDILAIEFEKHDKKGEKEVTKEQIREWMKELIENAKSHKIDYVLCEHEGATSPWFYACNFSNLIENKEKECKKKLAELIVPKNAYDFIDLSNLGNTLIPIIERPHWKFEKYKGAIHKIIEGKTPLKHKNKIPDIVLQRVFDEERVKIPSIKDYGEGDINSIPLTQVISTAELKKRGQEYQGSNPWHGSATGMNFCLNTSKNVWHCFRCDSGGGVVKAIGLNKGIIRSCDEEVTPDQFKKVLEIAREEYGLKKPELKEFKKSKKIIKEKLEDWIYEDEDGKLKVKIYALVKAILAQNHIKTIFGSKSEDIYVWKEGIWIKDGRGFIKTQVEKMLDNLCTNYHVNEALEKIKRKTVISKEEFFKVPTELICLKNCVLNLRTQEKLPLLTNPYFRNKLDINYDPEAKCPEIMKFINMTFYKEDIPIIQEWFGFSLWKKYFIKKGIIFFGPKDTGKTVLLNLIISFINEKNKAGLSLHLISKGDKFALSSLYEKLINVYDDLKQQDLMDIGGFKIATGGGYITGEYKFGDIFQFMNHAKMTFATNKIPEIKETDEAYYSRWLPIACDNVIPKKEQDNFLIEKLTTEQELSGLLNWALEGLKRLLDNGCFSYNKTIEETKELMERHSNGLVAFIQDCLVECEEGRIPKELMFEMYKKYAKENKLQFFSKEQIGRNLPLKVNYIRDLRDFERYWGNVGINQYSPKYIIDTIDTFLKTMRNKLHKYKMSYYKNMVILEVSKKSKDKKGENQDNDILDTFTKKEIKVEPEEPQEPQPNTQSHLEPQEKGASGKNIGEEGIEPISDQALSPKPPVPMEKVVAAEIRGIIFKVTENEVSEGLVIENLIRGGFDSSLVQRVLQEMKISGEIIEPRSGRLKGGVS